MAKPAQKNKAARSADKKGDTKAPSSKTAKRAAKPEAAKPPAYKQAKLAVSHPQDSAEKEADKVAKQVARAAKEAPKTEEKPTDKKAQRASLEPGLKNAEPVSAAVMVQKREAPTAARKEENQQANTPGKSGTTNVQREAADPMAGAETSPETEDRIEAKRGTGNPLPSAVAAEMGARFNRDFSAVRIHTDQEAAELCAQTRARAFTVGNDIFFAPGEYSPDNDGGRELLAHELTHVVQQGGEVKRLQRGAAPNAGGTGTGGSGGGNKAGKGKLKGNELHVPSLTLPKKPGMEEKFVAKYGNTNWVLPKAEERTNQIDDWKKQVQPSSTGWKLSDYLTNDNLLPDNGGATKQYGLKLKAGKGGQGYLVGTESGIREQAILPWWDDQGVPHLFDVDHILELQLGGEADKIENFQLLDASANRSSGSKIKKAIDKAIRAAIPPEAEGGGTLPENLSKPVPGQKGKTAASGAPGAAAPSGAPSGDASAPAAPGGNGAQAPSDPLDAIKASYKIIFDEVKFDGGVSGSPGVCWPATKVTAMDHMKPLEKATKSNSPDLYANDKLRLFPRPGAGVLFTTALTGNAGNETFAGGEWGGMKVSGGTFNRTTGSGKVTITLDKGKVTAPGTELNFTNSGIPTLCHIPPGEVLAAYRSAFKAKTLSPISLAKAEMDASANIIGGGTLTIDGIPLFGGASVDISLVGGDLVFSKTFATDEIDLKGPIQIDSCALTLSAGASTPITADGAIEFHIGELATGSMTGEASPNGFTLGAELNFEKKLFTGTGRIDYDSEKGMKAAGTLGLKPGALKGVKKADFTLAYNDAKKAVDFAGNAELCVPGFKGAKLSAHADDAGNISLAGEAQLSDTIPCVKSGKLNVSAQRKGEEWSLGGGGELEPSLPGLEDGSKIKIDYKDGVLDGKMVAGYKRGMLSGSIDLNAKAMIGGDGGEAEPMKVWGGGKVDVAAAPWLKASAGLTLDEKGEITVAGELGLPSSLQIFPRKEVNKSILSISTQIPIVPGIVAEVGGNLSAKAGIGPGQLQELKAGIEYSPGHEEKTHITGSAHLNVPMDAGLRLGARAGIGLGITGASATGGLELGGGLGIEGAAEASANIDWMPDKGLEIGTEAYVHGEPRFKLDLSGYVSVKALGFSVYDNRWEALSYELGSNLGVGVRFPIHYREGQPFDVSLNDVQFELPNVDPGAIVSQLGEQIF